MINRWSTNWNMKGSWTSARGDWPNGLIDKPLLVIRRGFFNHLRLLPGVRVCHGVGINWIALCDGIGAVGIDGKDLMEVEHAAGALDFAAQAAEVHVSAVGVDVVAELDQVADEFTGDELEIGQIEDQLFGCFIEDAFGLLVQIALLGMVGLAGEVCDDHAGFGSVDGQFDFVGHGCIPGLIDSLYRGCCDCQSPGVGEQAEQSQVWDRMPGESSLWFSRFEQYRMAGPGRSMLGVFNRWRESRGKSRCHSMSDHWVQASRRYQWRDRAEAWDDYQRAQDRVAWEARRRAQREQEWSNADKLQKRVEAMLQMPLTRQKLKNTKDGSVTIIEPANWTLTTLNAFIQTQSQLARRAAQMDADDQLEAPGIQINVIERGDDD